jgi:methylmalonyl-CoA/ethylmalonyl-CoA epimerase
MPVGGEANTNSASVHFDRIGQIALSVSDLARAKGFYQDKLGMRFLFEAGHLAFFQCGEIRIMLSADEKPEPRGETIVYYKVEDIHGAYAALKESGVEFIDAPHLIAKMPDHDLWMVFLKDPDGHTVGMMSEVRPAQG